MKLPKPRKRGNSWSVSIMVHGKREYCTRDTEQECLHWAMNRVIEANSTPKEIIEEKKKTVTTFHDLFSMYYKSHGKDTKSKKYIRECKFSANFALIYLSFCTDLFIINSALK